MEGPISNGIAGLLRYINEQTGQQFERLGEAVIWLVKQYKKSNK